MDDLEKLRTEIDGIDLRLLEALALRRKLAQQVMDAKDRHGASIRDAAREEQVLGNLIARGRSQGLDAHFVTRIFHEIIEDSIRSQELRLTDSPGHVDLKRVAFQGIEGAFSELAGRKFFAPHLDQTSFVGLNTFEQVVDAVEDGDADYGILPVENTTAGSINEVYDLLSCARLAIIGEEVLRVSHCLLAIEDVPLAGIRRVLSHPQALAQCMKFLSKLPNCEPQPYQDTAMAVKKVKEEQDSSLAAIASEEAGKRYGLKVLRRHLEDQQDNYTRFLIVAKTSSRVDARIPCKTSLVIATSHEEGALLKALGLLHDYRINLTKLESRPIPGMPFQYQFYLDFEGNTADARITGALEKLRSATTSLKVLGCYPSQHRAKTSPSILALVGTTKEPEPAEEAPFERKDKAGYRLAGRESKPDDTIIDVRGVRIGGEGFIMIAGPCAVESREQIRQCARHVKECGGAILRGGCFKPRTSPYSFQGLGIKGLELLAEAGRDYDLPVITEVLSPSDVEPVAMYADILQIGARNMQNFSLLSEVGRVNRPVMLKRGMMSTMDEFLSAAEYILDRGNHQVILCERGIRTFETATRNTLDLGSIPILKRLTHLPLLVDPSHAAGRRDLVMPLALAARAVGPHGLIVEIHPEPEAALSDGPQALRFSDFRELMRRIYQG
jgi:chorismate mutase / prephenate dehydratase